MSSQDAEKLSKYFALYDGTATWEAIETSYDDLFHPKVQMQGPQDTTYNFDEWKQSIKKMVDAGKPVKVEVESITPSSDGFVLFVGAIQESDGTKRPAHTKFFFEEGKLIRAEPTDKTFYESFVSKASGM